MEEPVWVECLACGATGAGALGDCAPCDGAGGRYLSESDAPTVDGHGERWG